MVDGQICYQADVDRFRHEVDSKQIMSEGFVFLMDYNKNRMVESGGMNQNIQEGYQPLGKKEVTADAMIYVETVGKKCMLKKIDNS